ncbi:endonuclease, partial [Pyxidicoccus sp. 3LFB2]
MKKTLTSLACATLSLTLLILACGEDSTPEVPLPLADGGVLWADCDPSRDGGACAAGEACRFVEEYGRSICVPTCDPQTPCEPSQAACCAGDGDGGAGGYCLPRA